ncbi:hypothetical protein O9H85_25165 [Paenibacillus filicis]|uniref:Glycine zipper 2TM domain-containing protein n=1 Tax=Paenibacillus gyeongsangnamensis TaxID=3388067 RepID=A0ABT4QFI7_9BACL|nr:hypothetical protein [Paenibacillus filicis]MCZ8515640.1 hypothetical protein [Paenibacillus filicis]
MFQNGSLWAGIVSGAISQVQDTKGLTQGQINRTQYAVQTTENVTGAFGVIAGVEYGAMLGTAVFPGVGTVIGSVVGGLLGDRVGRTVGNRAGGMIFQNGTVNQAMQAVTPQQQS